MATEGMIEVAVDVALKAKQRGNAHMEKREYRQAFEVYGKGIGYLKPVLARFAFIETRF